MLELGVGLWIIFKRIVAIGEGTDLLDVLARDPAKFSTRWQDLVPSLSQATFLPDELFFANNLQGLSFLQIDLSYRACIAQSAADIGNRSCYHHLGQIVVLQF